ncbi:MAG: NAD(P)-dependent oxidoreductase [Rhodobacter sp.]|nr:NAD(P)-dependent oxidoreductase [Rhodobacter sp.]
MKILYDPEPRQTDEIFSTDDLARFRSDYGVVSYEGGDRDAFYNEHLPGAEVLIGQQPMDRARLDLAPDLKAIFNVETNFLPNIDYAACFQRSIHVLAPSSVFAVPVAEIGLGMALSLARGIHSAHSDFVAGKEMYGLEGNADAELLTGSDIGFVGFGDLGRALFPLLAGFRATIRVHDPWLPDGALARTGVIPASLEDVLSQSRLVFVVAAITTENAHLLDRTALQLMQPGAMLVLLSRAAIADFDALRELAGKGRIRVATDVFPVEPVTSDDPIRSNPGILLSAHRAGALVQALHQIGALVLEDLGQISRGLPPIACKRAEPETVFRFRSKPIEKS